MLMTRRDALLGMIAGGLAGRVSPPSAAQTAEPLLWLVSRRPGRFFVFGSAEAPDRSWLTPKISRAFDASEEFWVETPPPSPGESPAALVAERGMDPKGTLWDALGPDLAVRVQALADEVAVPRTQIERMRPWVAQYVLATAYQARAPKRAAREFPEAVLMAAARERGTLVRSEFTSLNDLTRMLADMPDDAQRDYLGDLLDFVDDDRAGRNGTIENWRIGKPDDRFIQRMRRDRPGLYRVMHVQRNEGWARRIASLLADGKTRFANLGLNHVLGPDSIPQQLTRAGLAPTLV